MTCLTPSRRCLRYPTPCSFGSDFEPFLRSQLGQGPQNLLLGDVGGQQQRNVPQQQLAPYGPGQQQLALPSAFGTLALPRIGTQGIKVSGDYEVRSTCVSNTSDSAAVECDHIVLVFSHQHVKTNTTLSRLQVDVSETANSFIVKADVPGVPKDRVRCEVSRSTHAQRR